MNKKKLFLSIVMALILALIGVTNTYATTMEYFHNFTGLYLETQKAKIGEKVYVDFHGDVKEIDSVKVELVYEGDSVIVEVNDLETNNPYFIVPERIKTGVTYEMVSVITECEHGTAAYYTIKGNDNFTNCFGKKYLSIEKEVDVELTCLSLGSHYTTIEKNQKLCLIAEFKGSVKAEFVTMIVRNKENPEMSALVSLQEDDSLQYIDVFEIGTQTVLKNGTYYISDVFINPDNEENYVRYSVDETVEDARKLEHNVEFEIKNNTLKLSNLSLASHYTVMKPGYKLWLDVEIKGEGTIGVVTMIVRNKENPEMSALVHLMQDGLFQYIDVFNIGTQEKLADGTYYISEICINAERDDYIKYSLDECGDNVRKLEFYVEFEIDAEEDKTEVNIKDNKENAEIPEKEENKEAVKIPEKENNKDEVIEDNENEDKIESEKEEKKENNVIPEDTENSNKNNEEDSLNKKIYELLLKILELLSVMKNK